jgi:drug/metabolite transporter (DMT)-like permease
MSDIAARRSASEAGPYAMLLIAALILASNHIISRYLNGVLPPFGTTFWRFAIGGMVMLPFAGRSFVTHWPVIRSQFWFFVLLAVLFVPFSNGFIYLAYQFTTALNGGVVSTVQPALTVLLSALLFRDMINRKQLTGLILATLGVLVIVSRGDPAVLLALQFNIGDLMLVFAMFSVALYNVLLRKLPAAINVPVLLLIVQTFGCAVTLPVYIAETILYRPVPVTFVSIGALLWIGIAVTAIAVGLNNAAVLSMGANKASIGNYLRSIFTALLAIGLLGESFEPFHGVALALVIGGVWLLSRGRSVGR